MTLSTIPRTAFTRTPLGATLIALAIAGAHVTLETPLKAQDILYPTPVDVEPPVGERALDVEVDDYLQDEGFERRFLGRDVDFEIEGVPDDEYLERGIPEVDVDIQEHWEREGLDYIDRDPSDLYEYVGDENLYAPYPRDDFYEEEYYGGDFYEDEYYADDFYEDEYLPVEYYDNEYYGDDFYEDEWYRDDLYGEDDLDGFDSLEEEYVDENLWDGPSIYIDRTEDSTEFLPDSYGYPYGLAHPHTPIMIREDLQRSVVDFYTDDWYDGAAYFDEWYEAQESPGIEFDEEVGEVDVNVDLDR